MQEYIPQLERASTPLVGAKASAFVRPRLFVCIVRVFVLHCSVCSVFVRSCFLCWLQYPAMSIRQVLSITLFICPCDVFD